MALAAAPQRAFMLASCNTFDMLSLVWETVATMHDAEQAVAGIISLAGQLKL